MFLKDADDGGQHSRPQVACLAVAGVCSLNQCRLTNLDWLIDGKELQQRFSIEYVEVINDFVAQGYGLLTLDDSEVIQLSGPPPVVGASIGCVGAGTGLGQVYLTADHTGEYQAFPSEGGHQEFAPRGAGNDETQIDLLRYLKVKFSGWNRVSVERVVSGKGMCNVYEFLAWKFPHRIDKEVHNKFLAARQDASIIALNAAAGSLCLEAMQIFAGCYGAVCGTFALQFIPFGGLYLSGGVTQRLQKFLQEDGSFLEAFFDKGRVSPMLKDIPLFFVKGDEMGQRGAHLRAVRLLHHHRGGSLPAAARFATKTNEMHLAPPRNADLAAVMRELTRAGEPEKAAGDVVVSDLTDVERCVSAPVKMSSPR
jgi:glucokinase